MARVVATAVGARRSPQPALGPFFVTRGNHFGGYNDRAWAWGRNKETGNTTRQRSTGATIVLRCPDYSSIKNIVFSANSIIKGPAHVKQQHKDGTQFNSSTEVPRLHQQQSIRSASAPTAGKKKGQHLNDHVDLTVTCNNAM